MISLNFIKTILAERANRLARKLICREDISQEEYQYWFDTNPRLNSNGAVEKINLKQKLNQGIVGTNDLFRSLIWYEYPDGTKSKREEIVVKICKPFAERGPGRQHRISQINAAFYDEIRINNLVRSTNIEGVIRPLGGMRAGRLPVLKMEFIKGRLLSENITTLLPKEERLRRLAQMAYLANTISQLHYYQVSHMDLKPSNVILCQDKNHSNYQKTLLFDFGYSNSRLRDTVSEFGGQFTPMYNAPEQALQTENLTAWVDYYSFGIMLHEYLTGLPLFPRAMEIFISGNYTITEEYMEHLRSGKRNQIKYFPTVADLIDQLTIFDSTLRKALCPNMFDIAHKLKDIVKAEGYTDVNTDFLDTQLEEYHKLNF